MYVLMGANGNITSRAARALLQRGVPTRVIGRSEASLAPLQRLGAELAIGDARDADFLVRAFDGAHALYVMIPSEYGATNLLASQAQFGVAIASAIQRSGVRRVVNLSSIGAEFASGTGPIVGLHDQEQRLDALPGLDLLHLRPGYFMENHLHATAVIAAAGVYPSLERSDVPVPTIATADIATVVVRELLDARTRGVLHLHAPQHTTFQQVASTLGAAIGRPDLQHVQAERAEALAAMREAGFSADAAERMAEMAHWLTDEARTELRGATEQTPTTLAMFAPRFREVFEATQRGALATAV